jgi:competence protein ComEA
VPERSKWTAVAWAAVAAALVFAIVRAGGERGGAQPPPVRVDRGGTVRREGGGGLYVHVAGAVRRPGLYRIPEGSRVAAALQRAGGPTRRAEVAAVNLAAPVEDGQQVVVPARGPAPAAGSAGPVAAGGPGAQLSLATATADQLDELDGIGPTLAERVIEFRDKNGGFRSIQQLREVEGIGEKRFEALKDALRP